MVSNRNRDGILFSKPYLRVAAYCRVSSDKDEQYHSLDAQITYYKELINTNPNWVFAGVYADHASGRSNRKMKQFQEMMQACRDGKIDLILENLLVVSEGIPWNCF